MYAKRPMRVEKPDEKEEESMFHACIHIYRVQRLIGFKGLLNLLGLYNYGL